MQVIGDTDLNVGANLETMKEMRDQYADKQKEHLRNYKLLKTKFSLISKYIEKTIAMNERQNEMMETSYNLLKCFKQIDDDVRSCVKYFDSAQDLGIAGKDRTNKFKLYKELATTEEKLNDFYNCCDAINDGEDYADDNDSDSD